MTKQLWAVAVAVVLGACSSSESWSTADKQTLADIQAAIGSIDGTAQPATLAEVLVAVKQARDALNTNATTLGGAIADVNTALVGTGTTLDRATATRDELTLATQTVVALRKAAGGVSLADLETAIASLLTLTGTTDVAAAIADLQAQIASIKSGAATLADAVAAVKTLIGGSASTVEAGLNAAIADLKPTAGSLSTAIADVNTVLGGTGSAFDRASANPASVGPLLTAANAATIADVTTLVGGLKTCTGKTSLATATTALCPYAGYAALRCPQGGSGTGNELLLRSLSGLTNFTVSTEAANVSGTVVMVVNDGTAGRSYSVDTSAGGINLGDGTGGTAPIPVNGTVTLMHSGSGNTITLMNISGATITSATSLATAIADTFRAGSSLANNACGI